jgi:hypothetical protein
MRRGRANWSLRDRRRYRYVHWALCIHLAAAIAVTLLLQADWDNRQIFYDSLDPWLVGLYAMAWLGVIMTPLVLWIAFRFWRDSVGTHWTRIHQTFIAGAMLVAAWFAIIWHVAGTTLNY